MELESPAVASEIDKAARLAQYAGEDRIVSSDELREYVKSLPRPKNFRTGIDSLDKVVDGVSAGEVIAIGGIRKNGKTLLAQTITANLAKSSASVLWFSHEVPLRQFLEQMPPEVMFYAPQKLTRYSVPWTEDRLIEGKLKYDTRIIFIDNLHHMVSLAQTGRSTSLDIGAIIRDLKRMAIEHNLIIFILCHSTKPRTDKDGKEMEVSDWDIRDSSFIPQETDSVWMVQRSEVTREDAGKTETIGVTMVKVCTHRRTGAWGDKFYLRKVGLLFEECDENGFQIGAISKPIHADAKTASLALNYDPNAWVDPRGD